MPKAPPRKPAGAKESFGVSPKLIKCSIGVVVVAAVIGVSHFISPKPAVLEPATSKSAKPAKPSTPVSAVTELDDSSFDNFLAANPEGALVNFHLKGCHFCTKLAPEFEQAAQNVHTSGGPLFASLDSEVGPEVIKRLDITRFPTVLWFWKGKNVLELARAPEKLAEKIASWAEWAMTPAVQELDSRSEFEEALSVLRTSLHPKHLLIVAFNNVDSPELRTAIEEAAQRHRVATLFLFIKEASTDGLLIRAIGKEESQDRDYQGVGTPEPVLSWVKALLEEGKPDNQAEEQEEVSQVDPAEKEKANAEGEA